MRILFVNEKCGYFGGVEQHVADAAAALGERGHQCTLAYTETTGRDLDAYQACFDQCLPCEDVAQVVAKVLPDVIYFHKIKRIPQLAAYNGTPRTVRFIQDHDLYCPRQHKYFTFSKRVCHHRADLRCWLDLAFLKRDRSRWLGVRWCSISAKLTEMKRNRSLDRVLVGSEFMRVQMCQNGFDTDQVHVLPPLIRMDRPHVQPIPDDNHIVYVGQLIKGKGVDLLLRALTKLTCSFRATIVGTGNAQQQLENLSHSLGLTDRIQFTGWVPHDELAAFYTAAKVIVVPSRWPEPFGLIGVEAMCFARPVVAFNVGGISDWLKDAQTGLLVPEHDTTELARAITRVLTEPSLAKRLGESGLQRAQEKYDFGHYIDRLEAHLAGADLCDEHQGGAS